MSERELAQWCATESLRRFDRARPLWCIKLVPHVDGNNVGVLVVLHHVVADGLRGVAIIGALLDDGADDALDGFGADADPGDAMRTGTPGALALVVDNVRARARHVRHIVRSLPQSPRRVAARVRSARTALAEIRGHVPSTPLTVEIGDTRRLLLLRRPLDGALATAHARGVTLNDLVMASLSSGLRTWLQSLGERVDRPLRVSVPIGGDASNGGGAMLVPLPVDEPDDEAQLRSINTYTRAVKARRVDEGEAVWPIIPPFAPLWMLRLWVSWLRRYGRKRANAYVTNVPGPPTPLYLADARLLSALPIAPLIAGVALSVGVLSYAGTLSLAVHVDGAVASPERLASAIGAAFDRFCRAGRARSAQPAAA